MRAAIDAPIHEPFEPDSGAVCHALLRLAGHTRDAAVATLRTARALTADELVREARSGVLIDRMDALLATLR